MTSKTATPLCPNCYPAWPEKPVLVDDDGRCLACGRHVNSSWKDSTFDINHRERNCYANRMQRLLGEYRKLIDLGSNAAPFVLSDVSETLKALEQLESTRTPRYCDNAPVIPDNEKSPEQLQFEAYYLETRGVSPDGEPHGPRSGTCVTVDEVTEAAPPTPIV